LWETYPIEIKFCPNMDVFLGAIDTTRESNDVHYIRNVLFGYIEIVGMDSIVQICTNYILNMSDMTF
jgi:hypothetical protein